MSEPFFFLVYQRPDRTAPWSLMGFDSDPGAAEEKAARNRKERGGLTMVYRWNGFIRKESMPSKLPANWRE